MISAKERVVITGMGAITPNGLDMPGTWEGVRAGQSHIRPITLFDTSDYQVKIAGEAHGFDPLNYMAAKEARRADRCAQFAIAATAEAIAQARLEIDRCDAAEVGVYIGSGAGGIRTYLEQQAILNRRGPRHLSPFMIPMIVIDSAAVQVGIRLGVQGPNLGMASACATSVDAIGLALETIRRGDAQVMIAGGTEAAVNELGIAGFDQLRALSHRNESPAEASRPFDSERDGFVLSEGAVILLLESLSHARKRGAEPLAELRAYAATSDGFHLTAPGEAGVSAARCMSRALAKAGLTPEQIGYINAHAPGTPLGDPTEAAAIQRAFGTHTPQIAVSSTKSVTGHLLGAAGALATALTVCALQEGCLPPTINLSEPDPACELNHVALTARPSGAQAAIVPSYGFGGHNGCLVVTKWDEETAQ